MQKRIFFLKQTMRLTENSVRFENLVVVGERGGGEREWGSVEIKIF